jgi:SAM-dependent methyltransferase
MRRCGEDRSIATVVFVDLDDPTGAAFFALHHGLPREAPGSRESTARALALALPLPATPRVLDIGCGPGMQTMDLAELLPGASIVAVDLHPAFVAETRRRAEERGVAQRVEARAANMTALPFDDASFDLVWCEGAVYVMGLPAALAAWRRLLRPGGRLALTEAVWLTDDPPQAVRQWWHAGYPAMTDVPGCRAIIEQAGYELRGDFVLPASAWWDEYYRPLQARMEALAAAQGDDPVVARVLDEHREEIAMYERHGDCYGYAFFVMTR